jgi:hypothetical protein
MVGLVGERKVNKYKLPSGLEGGIMYDEKYLDGYVKGYTQLNSELLSAIEKKFNKDTSCPICREIFPCKCPSRRV